MGELTTIQKLLLSVFVLGGGAVSFASVVFLTKLVKDFAIRRNLVDLGGGRKVHKTPTPRLGGVAIFGGFAIGLGCLWVMAQFMPAIAEFVRFPHPAVITGALIMCAYGLVDDLMGLKPWEKLVGQSLMAVVVILGGYRFSVGTFTLNNLGIEPDLVLIPMTFVWILGVVNAVNLIDGMDGLATGVAFMVVGSLTAAMALAGGQVGFAFEAAFLGALIGFLVYNFHPAKIFMGDSGSLFIGFILATYALPVTTKAATVYGFLIPVAALGLPLLDTTMAFVRRLMKGTSPFMADKDHIHHRISLIFGLCHRDTVFALYGIAMVFGVTAIALSTGQILVAMASVTVAVVVVGVMLSKLGYFQPRRLLFRFFVAILSGFERIRLADASHSKAVALARKEHI